MDIEKVGVFTGGGECGLVLEVKVASGVAAGAREAPRNHADVVVAARRLR